MPSINDPNGQPAYINDEGQLQTHSIAEREALHVNTVEKQAFSILVDVTTGSTDDDFFYLKNNADRDLVIFLIEGWCGDANQEIKILIGSTNAGTDAGDALTPVNMNAGSGEVADVDCTQDSTDLAIAGGGVICLLKFSPTALALGTWEFQSGLILPKNKRLHMEAALAGLINLNIFFYYHD